MPKDYGTSKSTSKGSGNSGGHKESTSDARLSSSKGWSPPDGMPDPPGEAGKIPRPE